MRSFVLKFEWILLQCVIPYARVGLADQLCGFKRNEDHIKSQKLNIQLSVDVCQSIVTRIGDSFSAMDNAMIYEKEAFLLFILCALHNKVLNILHGTLEVWNLTMIKLNQFILSHLHLHQVCKCSFSIPCFDRQITSNRCTRAHTRNGI